MERQFGLALLSLNAGGHTSTRIVKRMRRLALEQEKI
jgi:hypothetical protein